MSCKALNNLFFSPSLWKYLFIPDKAHQSFLITLISRTRCGIRTIVASDIKADIVTEILKTDATEIRLLNMMEITLPQIPQKVKRLDLHSLFVTRTNLTFMMGSNLLELHLLLNIVPDVLIELKRNCLHLRSVTLGNCSSVSNNDILNFIGRDTEWKYLALLGAKNVNDVALQEMALRDIKDLILHSCHLITDSGINNLAQSKYLQWIKVIACRGLSLAAFDNTSFEGTLECVMKYSDFVNGKILAKTFLLIN